MNATSVYWIRHADHTDITIQGYVGVSKNAGKRFIQHKNKGQNPHLKYAINKYGWDNLLKSEVLVSTENYCLEIENKLRPKNNIGWNIVMGGGLPPNIKGKKLKRAVPAWNKGKTYSAETRKKISSAVKLAMQDPARREKSRLTFLGKASPRKGVTVTQETIEKIKLAKTGVSAKNKGILLTAEQKQNLSTLMRKNPWTCPHCQIVGHGVGAKNRWHFDNCIEKRS